LKAINDDLNMPVALATAQEVLSDKSLSTSAKISVLEKFDDVLGLGITDMKKEKVEIPQHIKDLLDEREEARAKKDFERSDKLRDEIQKQGFNIKDTTNGPELERC
jgi:cysteinyl-tRNA synthetase